MTDRYEIGFSNDPVFNTVTGLTNTTFDPNNIVENRMASEGQILQLLNRYNELLERADYCCRNIVIWKTYVRVISEETGYTLSPWSENVKAGIARRGKPFTVEFSLPLSERYFQNACIYGEITASTYFPKFTIEVNNPGRAEAAEYNFLSNTNETYGGNFYTNDYGVIKLLPTSPFWNSNGSDRETALTVSPFPSWSMTNNTYDHLYYMYKDGDILKVDVKRLDQYASNENLAVFFAQYVMEKGWNQ